MIILRQAKIVPQPLHWTTLFARRELLVNEIGIILRVTSPQAVHSQTSNGSSFINVRPNQFCFSGVGL
jgi:hypothetical protein